MKLKYHQKNKLLFILALGLAVSLWKFRLQETYNLYQENILLANTQVNGTEAKQSLSMLQMESLGRRGITRKPYSDETQMILVEGVSRFASENRMQVREVLEPHVDTLADFLVETNCIKVTGGFTDLNKLVYFIEEESKLGTVASCGFKTIRDNQARRSVLTCEIIIRNIWRK